MSRDVLCAYHVSKVVMLCDVSCTHHVISCVQLVMSCEQLVMSCGHVSRVVMSCDVSCTHVISCVQLTSDVM